MTSLVSLLFISDPYPNIKFLDFTLYLVVYFFVTVTLKPTQTASKEIMALARHNMCPDYQLLFQFCSTNYKTLQMKNSVRSASAINVVTTEIAIKHALRLSITGGNCYSASFSGMFYPLYSLTNKEQYENCLL